MAEIPVEKKSSKTWLWLLLAALLVVLIIWWLAAADDDEVETAVVDPAPIETVETTEATPMAGEMTLAAILAQPQQYIGQEFTGEVDVGGPLTDRGFWVENDGARMFALVIDQPREVPIDINAGQRLQVNGGMIRAGGDVSDVQGVALDDDTRALLQDQDVFMMVDESNIEILEAA